MFKHPQKRCDVSHSPAPSLADWSLGRTACVVCLLFVGAVPDLTVHRTTGSVCPPDEFQADAANTLVRVYNGTVLIYFFVHLIFVTPI